MVDKIKIGFYYPEFKTSEPEVLSSRGFAEDGTEYYKQHFRIGNSDLDEEKRHQLRVSVNGLGRITIEGSLRKWYYGKNTLRDFTQQTLYKALKRLSAELNIPFDVITNASVFGFEFGKNIRVPEDCIKLLQDVVGMSRLKMVRRESSIRLEAEHFVIRLYDKLSEMEKKKSCVAKLLRKRIHVLRYELSFVKVSAMRYKIGEVRSLYDIFRRWDYLVEVMKEELGKVIARSGENSATTTDLRTMSSKDYSQLLKSESIRQRGLENVLSDINFLNIKPSNKSVYRKQIIELWRKFTPPVTYDVKAIILSGL